MTQTVAFLYLDECFHEALDLAALTGVLVPLEHYRSVRDEMCRLVRDVQVTSPNTVPGVIELHGRELLSEINDQEPDTLDAARLHVLETVIRIVNHHKLDVLRVAYLNHREMLKHKDLHSIRTTDPKLYGLTFLGITFSLGRIMEKSLVIPVMDGIPSSRAIKRPPAIDASLIRAFAQMVRQVHHFRQYDQIAKSISIANAHNLGEPVFADSAHSVLLQLVDLVSYLLLQLDRDELEPVSAVSSYRRSVIESARALDRNFFTAGEARWKSEPRTRQLSLKSPALTGPRG
jgi:Protein of unknown function (DUF3800)